jgi:hypothetical protein
MPKYRTSDVESAVMAVMERKRACPQGKKEHNSQGKCETIKK